MGYGAAFTAAQKWLPVAWDVARAGYQIYRGNQNRKKRTTIRTRTFRRYRRGNYRRSRFRRPRRTGRYRRWRKRGFRKGGSGPMIRPEVHSLYMTRADAFHIGQNPPPAGNPLTWSNTYICCRNYHWWNNFHFLNSSSDPIDTKSGVIRGKWIKCLRNTIKFTIQYKIQPSITPLADSDMMIAQSNDNIRLRIIRYKIRDTGRWNWTYSENSDHFLSVGTLQQDDHEKIISLQALRDDGVNVRYRQTHSGRYNILSDRTYTYSGSAPIVKTIGFPKGRYFFDTMQATDFPRKLQNGHYGVIIMIQTLLVPENLAHVSIDTVHSFQYIDSI